MNRAAALLFVAMCFSCGQASESTTPPSPGQSSESAPAEETAPAEEAPVVGTCGVGSEETPERFGARLKAEGRTLTSLAEVIAAPESFEKQKVLTTGVVRASCLKKGCWMEIRPEDDRSGTAMTVRFEDYGFFVPLDSRGATVKLDGLVSIVTLSAAEVAHLEEEGATFGAKLPDGSVKQVEFTASGVEMCGRKTAR